MLKQKQTW